MKTRFFMILLFAALLVSACSSDALVEEQGGEAALGVPLNEEQALPAAQSGAGSEASAGSAAFVPANAEVDYFLLAPLRDTSTYLMDREGTAVYTWESDYTPGNAVYLLDDGYLLRTGNVRTDSFDAGGAGGIVEIISPQSEVVWSFSYANDEVLLHHDVEMLPNGNILMIAWEFKSAAEAEAAGRVSGTVSDQGFWPDHLIEVDPDTNQIVWEWHVWDHLIQDVDPGLPNYGVVSEHPEKIDINYSSGRAVNPDFNHINAVDYNADLDQILLSVHSFSEVWIIDHSTTTEQAAGEAGDLLYRWGNPQAYGQGTAADQVFFGQHNAQWIPAGYPRAGNILVFNNGQGRTEGNYSSVDELTPPLKPDGSYTLSAGGYGPTELVWSYSAENPTDFYSQNISGVQRLANGNTLVCSGANGVFFEVTPDGEVVWEYDYGGAVFRIAGFSWQDARVAALSLNPTGQLVGQAGGPGAVGGQPGGGQPGGGQPGSPPSGGSGGGTGNGPGKPPGGQP